MMDHKFNRRDFLRLCLLSAASTGLAACERKPTIATLLPSAVPTAKPGSSIHLNTDGDAWVWKKTVRGYLSDASNCKSILLDVNGSQFPAALSGAKNSTGKPMFSAEVELTPGENRLTAICQRPDGQEELSN